MSNRVIFRCDACGEEFEKGTRLAVQWIHGVQSPGDGFVWPGSYSGIGDGQARADLCETCFAAGVRVDAHGAIDRKTVRPAATQAAAAAVKR